MERLEFDLAVLGGGPGGYVAAIRGAKLGLKTVCVERGGLGGVCLQEGCIPSKALLSATGFIQKAGEMREAGIEAELRCDIEKLRAWKASVVEKMTGGIRTLFKGNKVHLLQGTGRLSSANEITVRGSDGSDSVVSARNIILATGSSPAELKGFEFDGELIISSREALDLKDIPAELLVVGGGYIGLEITEIYRRLGSKVTVVEITDQLIPGTDKDLVMVLQGRMKKSGAEIHLQSSAAIIEKSGGKAIVEIDKRGEKTRKAFDRVLVSVGRKPNTGGIGLEDIRVQQDAKGFILVDDRLKTAADGVFAIGDLTGNPLLAHKASREGEVAAEVAAGKNSVFDNRVVPGVVFTSPEIAVVGMTEAKAREQGIEYIKGKFPFGALGRAHCEREPDGFVKVIADASSHEILGVGIAGRDAENLIAEAALAIEMGARVEDVAGTIHAHPTFPEALREACQSAIGEAVHIL